MLTRPRAPSCSAHAAGAPWAAINALDAAVLAYNNISALRQQIEPVARVHGIILPSEDWACNVIPSKSKLQCERAKTGCASSANDH